jgi:hypothetical protein
MLLASGASWWHSAKQAKERREHKVESRAIIAVSKLGPVFGGAAKATMFEVPKHINRHLA